jgi:malate dehydrogenase (oxaloacetate-decarboxylating)
LGTILAEAKRMTDGMIVAGAKRLSDMAPALKDPSDSLLPPFGGKSWRVMEDVADL